MPELPPRSEKLILELLDKWTPVSPCSVATHDRGAFGCRPEAKAEYMIRATHGSGGTHEPVVAMACVWHVIWLRANARVPLHCVVCHASGTLSDFYEVLEPISHK